MVYSYQFAVTYLFAPSILFHFYWNMIQIFQFYTMLSSSFTSIVASIEICSCCTCIVSICVCALQAKVGFSCSLSPSFFSLSLSQCHAMHVTWWLVIKSSHGILVGWSQQPSHADCNINIWKVPLFFFFFPLDKTVFLLSFLSEQCFFSVL